MLALEYFIYEKRVVFITFECLLSTLVIMKAIKDYLISLCSIPSPSGYEDRITHDIKSILSSFNGYDVSDDALGNIIAFKKGLSETKTMLVAHCDEIGFTIKYIDDSGFIHFTPVGGVDNSILSGLRVRIDHCGTLIDGVVGKAPVHFSRNDKTNRNPDICDFWIDIGANGKDDAEAVVSVGDPITFACCFSQLRNDLFSSKSIDNRAGVAALLLVAEALQSLETNNSIFFVFSTQEELGLRGAITAGYRINPDVCIAVDATHATDYPGINKNSFGDVRLGLGPSIPIGANFSNPIQYKLRSIAEIGEIRYQVESIPGYSGTDIAEVQLTRGGLRSGLISIPTRYMHTPVEVASYNDIQSTADILIQFCKEFS